MKKVLTIVLATALLFTLVAVLPAFAETEQLWVDFVRVLDSAGAQTGGDLVAGFGAQNFSDTPFSSVGDMSKINDATYLFIAGWYAPLKEMTDIGYRVDGGDVVYGDFSSFSQETRDIIAGWQNFENADFYKSFAVPAPLQANYHEIELVAKFADSTTKAIYKVCYNSQVYKNYEGTPHNAPDGTACWIGNQNANGLEFTFSFKTDVSFYAIGFNTFWGYPNAPLKLVFESDGQVVKEVEFTASAAGDGALYIDLGGILPAGQYDVTASITSDRVWQPGDAGYQDALSGCYYYHAVFGGVDKGIALNADYFTCTKAPIAVDLYSTAVGRGFVTFDTTLSPQTADASMIIFIVAAAAIALVILKKKVF